MSAVVHEFKSRANDLWMEFEMARERHLASGKFEDGVAAGRAYAAFLMDFLHPDIREFLESREGRK